MRVFALGVLAALCAASAAADQLLSYEAIPSAQVELDLDAATYAQRAELTEAALTELVPEIMRAAGVDPASGETQITPGGYLLRTNASLQTLIDLDDAEADRLAAALGYVFRQWSVLVSEVEQDEGGTGYVSVAFPVGFLDADLAQAFFEFAAQTHEGLGGGYTAFGDTMFFLNVKDGAGAPFSGLSDMDFAARLGQAAGDFDLAQAKVLDAGFAEARFVGNDWSAAADGEDYVALLDDPTLVAELDALRARHTALVEEMASGFGWR